MRVPYQYAPREATMKIFQSMKSSATLPKRKKEGKHGTCQGGLVRELGDDTIIAHQRIAWATSTWEGVQDFLLGGPATWPSPQDIRDKSHGILTGKKPVSRENGAVLSKFEEKVRNQQEIQKKENYPPWKG